MDALAQIDRILEEEGYDADARALVMRRIARALKEADVWKRMGRTPSHAEKQRVRLLLEGGATPAEVVSVMGS